MVENLHHKNKEILVGQEDDKGSKVYFYSVPWGFSFLKSFIHSAKYTYTESGDLRGHLKQVRKARREFRWSKVVFIGAIEIPWYSCFQNGVIDGAKIISWGLINSRGHIKEVYGNQEGIKGFKVDFIGTIIFHWPSGFQKGIIYDAKFSSSKSGILETIWFLNIFWLIKAFW